MTPHRPVLVDSHCHLAYLAYTADTAAFVAELRGRELSELAATTTANFRCLFGVPPR